MQVPAGAKRNAVIRSVDRTLKWLDECLQRHEQLPALQPQAAAPPAGTAAASTSDAAAAPCQPMILGPIVGSDQVEQRARSARAVAGLPVGGFALCGFGTGETQEQQKQLMRAAVEQLPPDKLRLVSGLVSVGVRAGRSPGGGGGGGSGSLLHACPPAPLGDRHHLPAAAAAARWVAPSTTRPPTHSHVPPLTAWHATHSFRCRRHPRMKWCRL
jgi:hypothetical protein